MNEADTCRQYILPKIVAAGWDNLPHSITEQRTFTDGRIFVAGNKVKRGKQKRADYLLRYTKDFPIAVVEAKAAHKNPGAGLQQAKEYAEILGLKFAYSTNGVNIIEFDYITGKESLLTDLPSPSELWKRLKGDQHISDDHADIILSSFFNQPGKQPRYYQEIAINKIVQTIVQGKKRVLVTMATGTGKTVVSFQVCWKLWTSRWNIKGEFRKPRILFLADRSILVDDPKDKTFTPFGDARYKLENCCISKGREMYFATYQAIAEDERRQGLYREFAADFFDLIIIDECHRGSASKESSWREILEYFHHAVQLGMTATPLRDDNRDTYTYFGNPIYTYSLRQGIDDGFLAPYCVHRIITTADAAGWRPSFKEVDRYGREIPDGEYQTKDFERLIALRSRTKAIAKHLTDHLKKTDRFSKTIVFCVDQEHAEEMRRAINNLNQDLTAQYPNYVCRITSDEGDIGRGHLSRFQELETMEPVILTTSKLLTTGVDAPMVKNVALARVVGSMTEFKQIIGRGTRVRDDYGKYFFNILDYTGSATSHFADPEFDGEPSLIKEENIDDNGNLIDEEICVKNLTDDEWNDIINGDPPPISDTQVEKPKKFYVDGGSIDVIADLVYELNANGKQLNVVKYTDYTANTIRSLYPNPSVFREQWMNSAEREDIIQKLKDQGIDFEKLAEQTLQPDADPFDLLCHVAFNAPLRTRKERAERVKANKQDFFEKYSYAAREILEYLLKKYTDHGLDQFRIPEALKVPPISNYGNIGEIIKLFGSADDLRNAINELQNQLYVA